MPFWYQLWKTLQYGTWSIVTYRITSYEPTYLASRHQDLLKALQSGDPDIFAGGDAVRGADLVVTAIADGRTAAESIIEFLEV